VDEEHDMTARRGFVRLIALACLASMTLVGMSGVAQAKATHHHKGKGGGGVATSTPPPMLVSAWPYEEVETGTSEVWSVLQVETSPAFAGDTVSITSTQLAATCHGGLTIFNEEGTSFVLDDDGNVTVLVHGSDCAPGQSLVEADLLQAPYYTAQTSIMAYPPGVTPAGVEQFPENEVETGNSPESGNSNVYALFFVETSPVYAEQPVTITSPELQDRCGLGWTWFPGNGGTAVGSPPAPVAPVATTTLDDDGNAVFAFEGVSCAAGTSTVIADIDAGVHQTYVTTYTILPPGPTTI